MTLEQSWHPYLADKSSFVYKILERGVVTAIKNVYAQVNDEVTPTIVGFSETNIPASSVSVTTEKKVAVRFKVTFLSSEKASSKPLEDAVLTKSVAGILIYQNSLVIAGEFIFLVFYFLILFFLIRYFSFNISSFNLCNILNFHHSVTSANSQKKKVKKKIKKIKLYRILIFNHQSFTII